MSRLAQITNHWRSTASINAEDMEWLLTVAKNRSMDYESNSQDDLRKTEPPASEPPIEPERKEADELIEACALACKHNVQDARDAVLLEDARRDIRALKGKFALAGKEADEAESLKERFVPKWWDKNSPLPCGHDNRNLTYQLTETGGWYRCKECMRLAGKEADHTELRALSADWKEKAKKSREEARRIRRTVYVATEAEANCYIRAEVWDTCAAALEAVLGQKP